MKVLVIGCAKSGLGAAKLAYTLGNEVSLWDSKGYEAFALATQSEIDDLGQRGIEMFLNATTTPSDVDLVVLSPGVPPEIDIIQIYKKQGIEIIGEFEYASRVCKAPIMGITGTNGKTTTTALVGEIFRNYNPKTYVVGNIGTAFSDEVLNIDEDGIVIAELSSFQLEGISQLSCEISAILNISPDHLNRHHTMENYINAKYRIFENQSEKNILIINEEDETLKALQNIDTKNIVTFSSINKVETGTFLEDDELFSNINGELISICNIHELHILGKHNFENALAAIAIAQSYGVPTDIIRDTLLTFKGVEHRIEFVRNINNRKFYNDSKATNVGAAIPAIGAMRGKIRLIGGGMDKGVTFDEWVKLFDGKVETLYLIGETKQLILDTCKKYNFTSVVLCETLEVAIKLAYEQSNEGENILLS
ncbi:MAG: UDP-N-acetylmuramoylalanine--D-glutamate ligase, partial [Epulopiscium sp. Nele67-Bin005]